MWIMKLDGEEIEITLSRERRKNLTIRVVGNKRISASAPFFMEQKEIESFILLKKRWLFRRFSRYQSWNHWPVKREYKRNEPLMFQGEKYLLDIKVQVAWKHYQAFLEENKIVVWGPDENPLEIKNALIRWFTQQAEEKIGKRLSKLSQQTEIKYSHFALGNGKTLWGTCRQDYLIRINWRGIFLPPLLLDYILIHELCHCIELNHSEKFWKEVEKQLPDWKEARRNLKEYGILLGDLR